MMERKMKKGQESRKRVRTNIHIIRWKLVEQQVVEFKLFKTVFRI